MSDDEARELYAKMIHAIKCARHSTCFFPNQGAATGTPHKIILETMEEFNDFGDKGSSEDESAGSGGEPARHCPIARSGESAVGGGPVESSRGDTGDSGGIDDGRRVSSTGSDGCGNPTEEVINAWAEEAYQDLFYHLAITPSRPSTKSMIRYFGWKLIRDLQEADDAEVS